MSGASTMTSFRRARRPEQKAARAERILDAARELLALEPDSRKLSLNEVARRAGMAKSNVYRYFESREAILLALLSEGAARWGAACTEAVEGADADAALPDRLDEVARLLATHTGARPQVCHLISVLPSVLEHNVSAEAVRDLKHGLIAITLDLAEALHGLVPELTAAQHGELLQHVFGTIVGLWPLSHPSAVAAEVMREPAFAPYRHDFERDLARVVRLLAAGLLTAP